MGRRSFTPKEAGAIASLIVQGRLWRVLIVAALLAVIYLGATQGKGAALAALLVTLVLWLARPGPSPDLARRARELSRRD
jgi:hypothetical protein